MSNDFVFLEVNPCFQRAHIFCMDLQPAADPYNVVCTEWPRSNSALCMIDSSQQANATSLDVLFVKGNFLCIIRAYQLQSFHHTQSKQGLLQTFFYVNKFFGPIDFRD